MENTVNLYVRTKKKWMKLCHSIIENKKVQQLVFNTYLKPEKALEIKISIRKQFEELLPQIPDFGKKKVNFLSRFLINTALSLAFFRVLQKEGFQLYQIGQIMIEVADVYYSSLNPFVKYLMRMAYRSPRFHEKFKEKVELRNKSTVDPEDYHCTFVDGDHKNLLFGINYTNCAGWHFLKNQNTLEIAPYLCLGDYPLYKAINVGFNRSQNLAIGGTMCTFRFYREYPTPKGWPPEELDEYKNYKFKK